MDSVVNGSQGPVRFSIENTWNRGFTGKLTFTNPGDRPLNGWTFEFTTPFRIRQLWGGKILSGYPIETTDGNGYVYRVQNANWNRRVAVNGTANIGFNVDVPVSNISSPFGFELNGIPLGPTPPSVNSASPPVVPLTVLEEVMPEEAAAETLNEAGVQQGLGQETASDANGATLAAIGNGDGLRAEYFDNLNFRGRRVERIDEAVDFNWRYGSPASRISSNTFSARWTGQLLAQHDEAYTFSVRGNDGVRLWVNGQQLINRWRNSSSAQEHQGSIALEAGQYYDIRLEYYENRGLASVQFFWESDSQEKEIIPESQLFSTRQSSPLTTSSPSPSTQSSTPLPAQPEAPPQPNIGDEAQPFQSQPLPPEPEPQSQPQSKPAPQPEASLPTGDFNYAEALQKSFLFYEAQRSGDLPRDNRIAWRKDSALNDGNDVGLDLSGGYYDAGDHVKFAFPMAGAMTLLSWGVVEYRENYAQLGQLDEALDAIRWGMDWLLKAHVTDAQGTQEFWGQVGDGDIDHSTWTNAQNLRGARPSYKIDRQNPGTDLAAEVAAAMASASIIFRPTDSAYANRLLENAIQLYDFADRYRGKYSDSITDADAFYRSWSGYNDELVWGAAWIHEALEAQGSSDRSYLNRAKSAYQGLNPGGTHSWDNKSYGAAVLLAQETHEARYRNDVETWLNNWLPSGDIAYSNGGLAWFSQWGSLRYSANTAFLAGVYSDRVNAAQGQYAAFAEDQIDYILGDNPRNSSYLVGFGNNFPKRVHHRGASGINGFGQRFESNQSNAHILYGALVGGPESANDFTYSDRRNNFVANEVALDYNAAFTGSLARLSGQFDGQQTLSDRQLDALSGIDIRGI